MSVLGGGSGGEPREVGCGATVDLGDRVGIVPQRGGTAATVAQAGGGVAQVEAAREELAGRVMATTLDVELDPGGGCRLGDLVRGPVGVPRPGMRRVVGEQVRVIEQLDADLGQTRPDLVQVGRDQSTGVRVDSEPAVLMVLVSLRTP